MPAIHVWPKRLKEFLLAHPLYKSPGKAASRPLFPNFLSPP